MLPLRSAASEGAVLHPGVPDNARALNVISVCRTLPTPENPSAGTFVANRLRAMAGQAQVHVVQPVPYFPLLKPLPAWARRAAHDVEGFGFAPAPMFYVPGVLKSLDGRWLAQSIRSSIRRLSAPGRSNIIDAHFGYPDGVGCVLAAANLRLPAFITVRGSETDFLATPGIAPQLRRAFHAATGCISVSHSLRDLLLRHGVEPEKIRVIPNAVDRKLFRPGSAREAKQQLGLAPAARIIVSIGHLIAGKRHHVLVRAFAKALPQLGDAQLVIVGGAAYEPAYPDTLRQLIRELGIADRVRLVGRLPQVKVSQWLQAADAFALGTAREGCCNAVLEALASGRPVVTTPAGDNAHFVHDGVNGFIVPIDDVHAMEQGLVQALHKQWDADSISGALEVGDWDDVARQVLAFFAERLSTRSGERDA